MDKDLRQFPDQGIRTYVEQAEFFSSVRARFCSRRKSNKFKETTDFRNAGCNTWTKAQMSLLRFLPGRMSRRPGFRLAAGCSVFIIASKIRGYSVQD